MASRKAGETRPLTRAENVDPSGSSKYAPSIYGDKDTLPPNRAGTSFFKLISVREDVKLPDEGWNPPVVKLIWEIISDGNEETNPSKWLDRYIGTPSSSIRLPLDPVPRTKFACVPSTPCESPGRRPMAYITSFSPNADTILPASTAGTTN